MDMTVQEELTRQNERLRLLLSLTNKITSNLDLREVVRSISANVREVMLGDLVSVSLPDAELGKIRVYALDFPGSPGIMRRTTGWFALSVFPVPVKFAYRDRSSAKR